MHVIALKNLTANRRMPIMEVPCSMIISAGNFFSGVTFFNLADNFPGREEIDHIV